MGGGGLGRRWFCVCVCVGGVMLRSWVVLFWGGGGAGG